MRRARFPLLLALAALPSACARPPAPSPSRSPALPPPPFITPARISPDVLPASHLIATLPDGSRHFLIAGIRILERPDGSREQATTRLPAGLYRAMELPSRLGGGYLFVASAGGTTLLYRAGSWLGELVAITRLQEGSREIVAGFDRLYLRLARGDEWVALHPETGARISLGPLPVGPRIGPMAFVDAWRAVVVADLRGPMATFDAGASWRSIELGESPVTAVVTEGDDFILATRTGRHRLGPEGELVREPLEKATSGKASRPSGANAPPAFGKSLLRAAVEDGWPETNETALVAREGSLFRVRLRDGAVLAQNRHAYDAGAGACHAVALGGGTGFVCGAFSFGTSIHALEPGLSMREIARFAKPRVVVASGSGGLAIQGGCARDSLDETAGRFCIRTRDGKELEFRAPNASGRERVIALADGRVALIVPPSESAPGRLLLIQGEGESSVPLDGGKESQALSRAVWLEGFEEREPGILGGWVDLGGEARGVRIHLDGKVQLGKEGADLASTIVSGRFALALGSGSHRVRESKDGGLSWKDVDLPANLPRAAVEARSCGPVGCVAGGFLRVGWGEAEGKTLESPEPSTLGSPRTRGLSLRCEPTGRAFGPSEPPASPSTPKAEANPSSLTLRFPLGSSGPRATLSPPPTKTRWSSFRGVPPPPLAPGEIGFDAGTDPGNLRISTPLHIYAWGPKGVSWARSGKWLARFDDRFDLDGPRTTATIPTSLASEESAAELLDPLGGPPIAWSALMDPSGKAAVLLGCRSGKCASFGATQGGPLVAFQKLEIASASPASAVLSGSSFFVLTKAAGRDAEDALVLWRIAGETAHEVSRLPRAWAGRDEVPRLLRRASSDGLGLLVLGPQELERGGRDWFVLPLDGETGKLGEPVRLFGSHLEESPLPELCEDDSDGWLMDAQPSPSPILRVIGMPGTSVPVLTSAGVRLRLEGGRACIEAIAARGEGLSMLPTRPGGGSLDPATSIPLIATDAATGRRHQLRCSR